MNWTRLILRKSANRKHEIKPSKKFSWYFCRYHLTHFLKLFSKIDHYGTWLMPSGVIIGLLFPNLTILTKPFAETTVILMLTVSIFRLDPKEILIAFSNIRLLFCGTFFILIIIPLLIFLATILINIPAELKAILVAWGSCPPLVSMPGLALLIGLNGTAALLISVSYTHLTLPTIRMV